MALVASAAARLSRVASLRVGAPVRRMVSEPAVADLTVKETVPAVMKAVVESTGAKAAEGAASAGAAASSAGSAAGSATHKVASAWQKLVAFTTGVGVSSVYFYYTVQADFWASTSAIERSVAGLKADTAASSRETRERIAVLEHQMAALKAELKATRS